MRSNRWTRWRTNRPEPGAVGRTSRSPTSPCSLVVIDLIAWILALVALVAADRLVLGEGGPWAAIRQRIDKSHRFERGIVADRLAIQRLRSAPPRRRRAFVVGSSQARIGFHMKGLAEPSPGAVVFGKIAHGGFNTFAMRSMVSDVLDVGPDAVVLFLSPLDLNSRLQILPQAGFASFSAILDLTRETGVAFAFRHRRIFYRLLAANLLNSYRYRQVLDRAFAGRLRRAGFERSAPSDRLMVKGGTRKPLSRDRKEQLISQLVARFPNRDPALVKYSFHRIYNITRGEHCAIQQGLVRRTVRGLTQAGVEVVIVEAPLHPLAAEIYDLTIRDEYLDFAATLEQDFGAHVVPLESSGPFEAEDFSDPVHVRPSGAVKLTRATLRAVYQALELPITAFFLRNRLSGDRR